jgi:hypothetical protein
MTADELAAWREAAEYVGRQTGQTVQKPCVDCPASFRLAEISAGRCQRRPQSSEAHRIYNREWMRTRRRRDRLNARNRAYRASVKAQVEAVRAMAA